MNRGNPPGPAAFVFDWNHEPGPISPAVQLNDETLRDGLQSPSVREPPDELKRRLIHLIADLGIEAATIGYPAASERMLAQCRRLAGEAITARLPLTLTCVARAREADLASIAHLAQEVGCPIEAATFMGVSEVRRAAYDWSLDTMLGMVERAVRFAARSGLPVMFVAEDASRARPDTLSALAATAIRSGARRLCLADTTGRATPTGAARLVGFARDHIIAPLGEPVALDWHGHRDRGLALASALAAAAAGADRVHGTALGIGERSGNAEMELLLVNLHLQGRQVRLARLPDYCRTAARALGVDIPPWQPIAGSDAFRTGTGLHADAIVRALARGDRALADLLYSSLPPALGIAQQLTISPASGTANVRHWLERHGFDPGDAPLVEALLSAAKESTRALTDRECERIVGAALARVATHG